MPTPAVIHYVLSTKIRRGGNALRARLGQARNERERGALAGVIRHGLHQHAGLGLGVQGALSGAPVPQHIPDDKHGDHGQRRKQRLHEPRGHPPHPVVAFGGRAVERRVAPGEKEHWRPRDGDDRAEVPARARRDMQRGHQDADPRGRQRALHAGLAVGRRARAGL